MTWDEFIKEIISDRQYPETENESIIYYIDKEKEQVEIERKTIMDLYRKFDKTIYCCAGTITTKDSEVIDNCINRLIKAGNIMRPDIKVEYNGLSRYVFYIRNDVYSICYPSIISSINEGGETT